MHPPIAGGPEPSSPLETSWDDVLARLQEALYGELVISRELGRGGMAAVFLAHQLRLDRKVAIKVMAPSLMSEPGLVERFHDEAMTVARLEHPNIVPIYEVGSAAGLQYFLMQYVHGRSLERAARHQTPLAFDVVRAVALGVGGALDYAHRHEVIHRDVKPGNVLLSLDGRVIVGDFGIAKAMAATGRTQSGAVIGTPAYMSPEQSLGRTLTWSSDQYSLGVVLYELVTGAKPFTGPTAAVMRSHAYDPPPPISSQRSDCPVDLASAIERMLAKDPADRFPSIADALLAMGATRVRIDPATDEAIGQLAIPLPDEHGTVLVHTPVSPALGVSRTDASPAAATTGSPVRAAILARESSHRLWRHLGTRRTLGLTTRLLALSLIAALSLLLLRPHPAGKSLGSSDDPAGRSRQDTIAATITPPTNPVIELSNADDTSEVESVATVADSAAASLVLGRHTANLSVGDSIALVARVLNGRGDRLRGYRVRWSVDDPAIGTIDPINGTLHAIAAGRVRVTAAADTLVATTRITITPRATPRADRADDDAHRDRERSTLPPIVDVAAEREIVADILAAFVRTVLINKDVESIRRWYQTPAAADIEARDSLIAEIVANPKLSILPPGSSPPPRFSGDESATAATRLTLRNTRATSRRTSQQLWIQAELRRDTGAWAVIGFRIVSRED